MILFPTCRSRISFILRSAGFTQRYVPWSSHVGLWYGPPRFSIMSPEFSIYTNNWDICLRFGPKPMKELKRDSIIYIYICISYIKQRRAFKNALKFWLMCMKNVSLRENGWFGRVWRRDLETRDFRVDVMSRSWKCVPGPYETAYDATSGRGLAVRPALVEEQPRPSYRIPGRHARDTSPRGTVSPVGTCFRSERDIYIYIFSRVVIYFVCFFLHILSDLRTTRRRRFGDRRPRALRAPPTRRQPDNSNFDDNDVYSTRFFSLIVGDFFFFFAEKTNSRLSIRAGPDWGERSRPPRSQNFKAGRPIT